MRHATGCRLRRPRRPARGDARLLLTGIASLLDVFTQRLARIPHQVSPLAEEPSKRERQLGRLRLRSRSLDLAVMLAAIAGALICCAALTLFLHALRSGGGGTVLFALFGGALVCAVAALAAFAFEVALAGRTVREMVDADGERPADPHR